MWTKSVLGQFLADSTHATRGWMHDYYDPDAEIFMVDIKYVHIGFGKCFPGI